MILSINAFPFVQDLGKDEYVYNASLSKQNNSFRKISSPPRNEEFYCALLIIPRTNRKVRDLLDLDPKDSSLIPKIKCP